MRVAPRRLARTLLFVELADAHVGEVERAPDVDRARARRPSQSRAFDHQVARPRARAVESPDGPQHGSIAPATHGADDPRGRFLLGRPERATAAGASDVGGKGGERGDPHRAAAHVASRSTSGAISRRRR